MSGFMPVNPRPMLLALVGKEIRVRLKWGYTEYTGALVSADSYMNLQLANTEEFINGESQGTLGQVLIRCNNVLWISSKDAADGVRRVKSGKERRNQILNQSTARTKRLVENENKNSAYSAASGSHSSKAPVTPAPNNNNNTAASSSRSAPSGSATTSSIKRERDNDVEDFKIETPAKKRVKREE